MSELKQGDKVTHRGTYWNDTYTLVADPRPGYGTAEVKDERGVQLTFSLSNLTKVEEPKPEAKVGDRILVHEALALFKDRHPGHLATVLEVEPRGQKGRLRVQADEKVDGSWDTFMADSWTLTSRFKAGDRVRAERSGPTGTSPRGEWVEGVLLEVGLELPNELVLKKDDGHRVFVYADTAKKVEGFPVGTVAVSRFVDHDPAIRQPDGTWGPSTNWGHLTDEKVRTNPYFTIVHEPASS